MQLLSPRLSIRRFQAADVSAFHAYRSDPDVARYQSWSVPFAEETAERLVAEFAEGDPHEPGWFQYAVADHETGQLVGDIGVCLSDNLMQAELGFTIAAPFQGRGLGTEAVTTMLDHLFTQRKLHRVAAECDARNTASARLLERVGFTREGLRRQHTWIKGEWTDDVLFGLLAADWVRDGLANEASHR